MEKSTPMALISAKDIETYREAVRKAYNIAVEWMNDQHEVEYDDEGNEISDDSMEFEPEFDEYAVENTDDILVSHEITDDRWGYLLHENGDIFHFLDENGVEYTRVHTIENKILKHNPYVLGGDDFYAIDGSHARMHHVGDLIDK